MIWIIFLALSALALFLLLRPLFAAATAVSDARSAELAVYRDQLRELDAELARGAISPAEADAARNEIKRKMLAVAPTLEAARNPKRAACLMQWTIGIGLPLLAFGIYVAVGQPGLVETNAAAPATETKDELPDIETLAARLAELLKKSPDDAKGWRMLGWTYASLERYDESAKAYERAATLDGKNAEVIALYGEALVRLADGKVTQEAEKILDRALAIDPQEPRAQFYRGLALDQHGKPKEALDQWIKIIRENKADEEWMQALRNRASEQAIKLKLDPARVIPKEPPR